ncbi:class I SAM-dependent methyltransferase [Clostridium sp.]|uniref:class I SAM-dependent methyltransferase n=1 Tax=Clostridium sp. TaxID=1506 RepID=UPI003D6CC2BE
MIEISARIFDLFMKPFEKSALSKRRRELIPQAKGNVLEIGAGTGMNFDYYISENISKLTIVELNLNGLITKKPLNSQMNINYVVGNVEKLPFPDGTFDSVVSTLIYCSVDNPDKALSEVYRVLKPGGKMYFIEHVLPEEKHCKHLVNSLNGTWRCIGKCNVNRETLDTIKKAKFRVESYEQFGKGVVIFIKGIGVK